MKHVLGSIVETCQTVTTQNRSDSALMKRVVVILEARHIPIPLVAADDHRSRRRHYHHYNLDYPVRFNDVEFLVDHFD